MSKKEKKLTKAKSELRTHLIKTIKNVFFCLGGSKRFVMTVFCIILTTNSFTLLETLRSLDVDICNTLGQAIFKKFLLGGNFVVIK